MAFEGDFSKAAGTTFVQANSTSFRDLVQRLTGPIRNDGPSHINSPSISIKPAQNLHERRKYTKSKLEIRKPNAPFQFQPKIPSSPTVRNPIKVYGLIPQNNPMSPSSTPVSCSNKRLSPSQAQVELNPHEEEKAIKEKRFYLHPSPRSKQRLSLEPEPELLTLFPLESPNANRATNN